MPKARSAEFFASCMSANDLFDAAGQAPLSEASRTFLDAVSAAPWPSEQQRKLWGRMSRQPWPRTAPKHVIRASGRGSGKTTDDAKLALYHALCVDHDAHAMAGSRVVCILVAPKREQSADALRICKTLLDQLGELGVAYEVRGEKSDDIEIAIVAPRRPCERVLRIATWDALAGRGAAICYVGLVEFAHGYTGSEHVHSDRVVLQAVVPRLAQFPRAQLCAESTPGPPRGQFFEWLQRPPADSVVVRGSTFLFNPAIDERTARQWVPDARMYAQEILAERFGHGGDSFLEPEPVGAALDLGEEWTRAEFGPESSVVCCDAGQLVDYFAIGRFSPIEDEVAPGKTVRHVVATELEHHKGNRDKPIRLEDMVRRAIALSEGKCPICFDQHLGVEMKGALAKAGYREVRELRDFRGKRMMQMSTSAAAQTARWLATREVCHGRRLHVPASRAGQAAIDELCSLHATEIASGLLRVEGVGSPDDLADVIALGVFVCMQGNLTPADRGGSKVVFKYDALKMIAGEGLHMIRPRYVKQLANGKELPAEMPSWAPGYDEWARGAVAAGLSSPALEEWRRQQERKRK